MSTAREVKRSTNVLRKVNINLFENYIMNMIKDQSILICVFLAKLQKAVKEGEILKENPSCLTFAPLTTTLESTMALDQGLTCV